MTFDRSPARHRRLADAARAPPLTAIMLDIADGVRRGSTPSSVRAKATAVARSLRCSPKSTSADGAGLSGVAVDVAAEISSLAGAGEILVSSTVDDLVVGSGMTFQDGGIRRLAAAPGERRLLAFARASAELRTVGTPGAGGRTARSTRLRRLDDAGTTSARDRRRMSTITATTHHPPESGPVAVADRGRWERVLMRAIYDPTFWLAERLGMSRRRAGLLAHAEGRVLEIGAGTGLNAGHWPDGLDGLVVTEPLTTLLPRIRRRLRRAGRDASVLAAEAERLPLADDSIDTVVSTMVLCTVGDVAASLREVRRVLRPGGRLLFMEHVRADGGWRARAQDLVHRPWRAFGGGCNCNLPTLELIRAAGFDLDEVKRATWRGMPFCVKPLVLGSAR